MQVRSVTGCVVSKVGLAVVPALRPSGAKNDQRSARDGSARFLLSLDVLRRDAVISVLRRLRADVDEDHGADEAFRGNLVDGQSALGEMNRGVDVRSTVLGRAERVRAVEESPGGPAVAELLELEAPLAGGQVERFRVERMRKIDQHGCGEQ